MTDEQTAVPLSRWPDPVCRYTHDDGSAVVEAANEAFRSTFGSAATGESVVAALDELGLQVVSGQAHVDAIEDADTQVIVESSGDESSTRYVLRAVSGGGTRSDTLVATALPGQTQLEHDSAWVDLDHVASVVSHDLRNPLDVAKARLRAARETDEERHFEHVAQAHDRMERIIEDVLTLARGADVVEPDEEVDLKAVAETAWETVDTDHLTLSIERPLPIVVADSARLRRLFENLFRNSVEHGATSNQAGSGDAVEHGQLTSSKTTASESARRDDAGGLSVTVGPLDSETGFYVADDGQGIPTDRRGHVFEPGYSTDEHGTGLGLSIVAQIVSLHGWSITTTASASGGARFEIVTTATKERTAGDGQHDQLSREPPVK